MTFWKLVLFVTIYLVTFFVLRNTNKVIETSQFKNTDILIYIFQSIFLKKSFARVIQKSDQT